MLAYLHKRSPAMTAWGAVACAVWGREIPEEGKGEGAGVLGPKNLRIDDGPTSHPRVNLHLSLLQNLGPGRMLKGVSKAVAKMVT